MSLTLPYATAVNCKFVNLPDTLATNDNTLKLYNIDGGGGGGTTDAYTKAESDARFLRLAAATAQTVTQIPYSSGIKMNPGAFLDWSMGFSGTTNPIRFKTGGPGATVSLMVSNQTDAFSRSVYIPAMEASNTTFLVDKPTNPQTINKSLTIGGDLTTQALKFSATPTAAFSSSTNDISVAQETTTGTVPSTSAVCSWTKNYAIPKTDLVTTVTGTSDSKVPSEWAVKRYVDASGSGNAVLKTGAQTMEGPLEVPELKTSKIVLNGNTIIRNWAAAGGTAKDLWVPGIVNASAYMIISEPGFPQTIKNGLDINGLTTLNELALGQTLGVKLNSATNDITAAQETTTGTIPSTSAVCNWTKNYAIPKTDIVTTVTGVSDAKVPSEKAVKTYVDGVYVAPVIQSVTLNVTSSPANVVSTTVAHITTTPNGFVGIRFPSFSCTPTIEIDYVHFSGIDKSLLPISANGIYVTTRGILGTQAKVGFIDIKGGYWDPSLPITVGLLDQKIPANQNFVITNSYVSYNKNMW